MIKYPAGFLSVQWNYCFITWTRNILDYQEDIETIGLSHGQGQHRFIKWTSKCLAYHVTVGLSSGQVNYWHTISRRNNWLINWTMNKLTYHMDSEAIGFSNGQGD